MKSLQLQKSPLFFLTGFGMAYGLYKLLISGDTDGLITIAASVAMLSAMYFENRVEGEKKEPVTYKVLGYGGIALSSALISFVVVSDFLRS